MYGEPERLAEYIRGILDATEVVSKRLAYYELYRGEGLITDTTRDLCDSRGDSRTTARVSRASRT